MKKTVLILVVLSLTITGLSFQPKKKTINNSKIIVDIWSDVVCPFCLIGKKKIEKAITDLKAENNVILQWHSYQLDPSFPMNHSVTTKEYLVKRKGYPESQVITMQENLVKNGIDYGIDFKFEKAKSFNTFDAHRLIQWAKKLDKSNELKEALMVAFFTRGIDLSVQKNLIQVTYESGLDSTIARQILGSEKFKKDVQDDIKKANSIGVRGVPYFVINGKEIISGAQTDQVFKNALEKALQIAKKELDQTKEGICLPDGECK
jgi:predicted DsbA family dithiol-disulfide isomerase